MASLPEGTTILRSGSSAAMQQQQPQPRPGPTKENAAALPPKDSSVIDQWLREQPLTRPIIEHFDPPAPAPMPPGGAIPTRTTEGMPLWEQFWQSQIVTPFMKGVAGMRAIPRMLYEVGRGDWSANVVQRDTPLGQIPDVEIGFDWSKEAPNPTAAKIMPTYGEIRAEQYKGTGIPETEATSKIGQYSAKAMEAAVPVLLGMPPGASSAGPAIGGAMAGSVGGNVARDLGAPEGVALGIEMATGVGAPAAASKVARTIPQALAPQRSAAANIMNEMRGDLTNAEIAAAREFQQQAASEGYTLSLAQAAAHLYPGRAAGFQNLQRVIESAVGGEELKAAMAGQTQQFRQGVQANTQRATPFRDPVTGEDVTTYSPEARENLPGMLQERGEQTLQRQREARGEQTRPQYQQAEGIAPGQYYFSPEREGVWREFFDRPTMRRTLEQLHAEKVGAGQPVHQFLQFDEAGRLTGIEGVPSPNDIDDIIKAMQRDIDARKNEVGYVADNDPMVYLKNQLQEMAAADIPNYQTAQFTHGQLSPAVQRQQEGTVGAFTRAGQGAAPDAAFTQKMMTLLPKNPKVTSPESLRSALRQMNTRGDPLMQQAMERHIRGQFEEIARATKTNQLSEGGGAGFRAWMAGNPDQAAQLRVAIEETYGPERWQAFQNMLDYMQASGNRLVPGSQTTFNQAILDLLQQPRFGVSPVDVVQGGAALASGQPTGLGVRAAQGIEGALKQVRGKTRTRHLVDIMLDRSLDPVWQQLSTARPDSPNFERLLGALIGYSTGATQRVPVP